MREDGRRTVALLTSRQAAVGNVSSAAREPEAPLAPHERVCFACKVSKAALNNRCSADRHPVDIDCLLKCDRLR